MGQDHLANVVVNDYLKHRADVHDLGQLKN